MQHRKQIQHSTEQPLTMLCHISPTARWNTNLGMIFNRITEWLRSGGTLKKPPSPNTTQKITVTSFILLVLSHKVPATTMQAFLQPRNICSSVIFQALLGCSIHITSANYGIPCTPLHSQSGHFLELPSKIQLEHCIASIIFFCFYLIISPTAVNWSLLLLSACLKTLPTSLSKLELHTWTHTNQQKEGCAEDSSYHSDSSLRFLILPFLQSRGSLPSWVL